MITIGTILDNFSYVAIAAVIIGSMVFLSYMQRMGENKRHNMLYGLIAIVQGVAIMIPVIWLIDFVATESTEAITDLELFSTYIPMFILMLCTLYGLLILQNVMDKTGEL